VFDENKDERLRRIAIEAGAWAFAVWFFLALLLTALTMFGKYEFLLDADILLTGPWAASTLVFIIVLGVQGYFRTLREERNRTHEERRSALVTLLSTGVLIAAMTFAGRHFNVFDDHSASITSDAATALLQALGVVVILWLMEYRRGRTRHEEE
jgi:cation transport ATPase